MKRLHLPIIGPQYKEKFKGGKTIGYMFLPPEGPACNERCSGCYVLASESKPGTPRRPMARILSDLRALSSQVANLIPITTELLMFPEAEEILRITGQNYVNTNGKALVADRSLLDRLKIAGVCQIVLTGNFDSSGLRLTDLDIIEEAIRLVQTAELELTVTVRVTRKNLDVLDTTLDRCVRRGIRSIQFVREIPLESCQPETLDETDTRRFFEFLKSARMRYPLDRERGTGIHLSAGGTFGTQYRVKKEVCSAGTDILTIGLDDRIYPCIFITQNANAIGRFENGQIILDRKFEVAGDQYDCPAHRYAMANKKQGGEI